MIPISSASQRVSPSCFLPLRVRRPICRPFHPTPPATMPSYIVTLKPDATPEQVEQVKKQAVEQGGTIGHEYSLIKGFQVIFPEGAVHVLESHEQVEFVEQDQEVRTQ
ncbi:hypothetical protein VTJ83DRAFT_4722 [Remersonia thermophila]|uniref:Inhibitor I9 domain-containing protein n=1 Tax=Remersonia thermophila TaxID=72144 RepID=A0ABR4DAR2_9PEZI